MRIFNLQYFANVWGNRMLTFLQSYDLCLLKGMFQERTLCLSIVNHIRGSPPLLERCVCVCVCVCECTCALPTGRIFIPRRFVQLRGIPMTASWFPVAQTVLCTNGVCPQERERPSACSSPAATTASPSPLTAKSSLLLGQTRLSRRLQIPQWVCPCPSSGLLPRSAEDSFLCLQQKGLLWEQGPSSWENTCLLIPRGSAQ